MEPSDGVELQSIATCRPSRVRTARCFRNLAELIPDWIGLDADVQLCDFGLGLEYRDYEDGALFELVALWVGLDPRYVHELPSLPQWLEEHRAVTPSEEVFLSHMFLRNLSVAVEGLLDGKLKSSDGRHADPPEATVISAVEFASWALQIKLPRPAMCVSGTKRLAGGYTTPTLDVATQVIHRFYRYTSDGGTYDPEDPTTHPHPNDVKQAIRDLGVGVRSQVELIYKIVRDPRIPVGRRKKAAEDVLP